MNFMPMSKALRPVPLAAALALVALSPTNALGFTINIDPGAYVGSYNPAGQGFVTGPTTAALNAGTYSVGIAPGNGFSFVVDASGNIASVSPATAAQGNGSTLTFTTTTITVNPGAYTGTYSIAGVNNTAAPGVRSFVLMPGLTDYILGIAPGNDFRFHLDGSGNIAAVNPAAAAQGNGSILLFNTTTILVDPGAYTGTYSIRSVNNTAASGQRSFILIKGLGDYILDIAPGNDFRFRVDGNGAVGTTTAAAVGVGNTLAFNTTTIAVVPRNYSGPYSYEASTRSPRRGSDSSSCCRG